DMEHSTIAFQYLCDRAGEDGITVASENILSPERFRQLYQMVDRKNFGLYFDSQNYQVFGGFNEVDILNELYPYMCSQLHVKDGPDVMSGGLLGTGTSDFHATMRWLDEHGYTGHILLENYYDVHPLCEQAPNPYDLLREDIRILKEAVAG
ncbi:MAG: sugar phosphate isomerase/epimerase, partial [Clostridiales bacterium]|nr:sugar phosphate isomerase/epimerase [Clostridiales bacterium]